MNELDPITLNVGAVYEDEPKTLPGFTTYVDGEVDTNTAGVYTITYTLIKLKPSFDTETWTREVTVTSAPTQIGSITLNGDPVISIALSGASTYSDAGATSSDGTVLVTNLDGTASESFTGLPNIAGSYTLIYYTPGSFSNFVTRTIHVVGGGIPSPVSGPQTVASALIPSSGPKNIAVGDYISPPTSGPQTVASTLLPSAGPKDVDVSIPLPTTGPKTADLEHIPVTPAKGYPIEYVFDETPNAVVTPNVGFPIETVESDTSDPTIPIKPNVGFPIETVESDASDPTIPIKPNVGFPIETIESDTSDPTIPIKPNVGFPIETMEDLSAADPTTPVKPNVSYPIENLE